MKKKITAEELMARLNADPDFVAKRAEAEAVRQERETDHRIAEAPLVGELRAAGVEVSSVWDLVNTSASYPAALLILLHHLQRPYPAAVREGIARALAVPEAFFGWNVITRLYRDEQESRVKSGLAAAISASANDSVISDVVTLVRDSSNGPSRLLLLSALERSGEPDAHATLMDLADDPELSREIQIILPRLKRSRH